MLLIVCAGVVLASLDLFIVNVALPRIAVDLHAPNLGELSWVLNGYAIVYASLLVFFGRLADRYRRDRAFLIGVAVFTIASAACAASGSVAMLIAFRLVQAAGAALLTPTSLGLVLAAYPPERRHGAVRAWTATGGLAAALGPVAGGLLVQASWRWVFLVNVPVGIAALVAGWRLLPHVPGHDAERPDPLGVVLVTGGVGALTFGLVQGSAWGWGSGAIVGTLAAAVVLLALFAAHCRASRNPLIDPALFRSRAFTGASLVAITFSAAFAAMLLSIVLWEQGVWGWSALQAGLGIAPGPLMVPLMSFVVAAAHRPLRPRAGHHPGHRRLLGRPGLVGGGHRAAAQLRQRRPGRDDPHRDRRGPDPADHDGDGLVVPPAAVLRDRVGRRQHDPPDRPGPGGGRPGRHPRPPHAPGPAALAAFRHGWWAAAGISLASVVPALALLRRGAGPAAVPGRAPDEAAAAPARAPDEAAAGPPGPRRKCPRLADRSRRGPGRPARGRRPGGGRRGNRPRFG